MKTKREGFNVPFGQDSITITPIQWKDGLPCEEESSKCGKIGTTC